MSDGARRLALCCCMVIVSVIVLYYVVAPAPQKPISAPQGSSASPKHSDHWRDPSAPTGEGFVDKTSRDSSTASTGCLRPPRPPEATPSMVAVGWCMPPGSADVGVRGPLAVQEQASTFSNPFHSSGPTSSGLGSPGAGSRYSSGGIRGSFLFGLRGPRLHCDIRIQETPCHGFFCDQPPVYQDELPLRGSQGSSPSPSQERLDVLARPDGRLLAHSCGGGAPQVPDLHHRGTHPSVCSSPVRMVGFPSHLHQGDAGLCAVPSLAGHSLPAVCRRPSILCLWNAAGCLASPLHRAGGPPELGARAEAVKGPLGAHSPPPRPPRDGH
jgi:hypothetical protein